MTVKVTGYQKMSFTDGKTGELVQGTSVFYLHDDMETVGKVATKIFFNKGVQLPELIPGSDYIMEFGPKGKLQSFELAKE